jgi:hypothetical protein
VGRRLSCQHKRSQGGCNVQMPLAVSHVLGSIYEGVGAGCSVRTKRGIKRIPKSQTACLATFTYICTHQWRCTPKFTYKVSCPCDHANRDPAVPRGPCMLWERPRKSRPLRGVTALCLPNTGPLHFPLHEGNTRQKPPHKTRGLGELYRHSGVRLRISRCV